MKQSLSHIYPPRWATRLLKSFCAQHLSEEIEGDLEEEFHYQVKRAGLFSARLDYVLNVLGFIKPFAIRRKSSTPSPLINTNMFKHYLVVAIRNLVRHKTFSAINIAGLALGMTCCLFIYLWVQDEKKVDNFHANGKQLYTLYYTQYSNGDATGGYAIPYVVTNFTFNKDIVFAEELKASIPDIEYATSYATCYELPWGYPMTFQSGEKIHKLEGSQAGEDFFTMFSYPILAGDSKTALGDISSIVISRKMAAMFFGSPQEAIGKSIRYENRLDFVVTAVFEDIPSYSSIRFDYLLNWKILQSGQVERSDNKWPTYIQLHANADIKQVEQKLKHFLDNRIPKDAGFKAELGLQPFGDQYLISSFVQGKPDGGRIEYVRIFSGVAVFILIIACINFMNMATARSIKRAKEVGIRKVVGSSRFGLIGQFYGEAWLLSFLALTLSLGLLHLLLPVFNNFTGKRIISPVTQLSSWMFFAGLVVFTGLIAGSYPALFLSSLKPVRTLKGVVRFTSASIWFRKGLAVFQFSLSIILLIATIVVSQQTRYVQNRNLGYDRENLIYIRIEGEMNPKYSVFKEKALGMPGISMVDRSSEAPHAMGFVIADAINWEGQEKGQFAGFKPLSVGYDFLKVMNLKISEGRDFSKNFATDSADAFMVNEEAVRQMGMKDPIGKWVSAWQKKGHIIAVLKDYHTHSLHEKIKPLIMDIKEYEYFGVVIVRTEPGKTTEALAGLEKLYKEINPNYPFLYQFVDVEYGKLYRTEQVMAKLSNIFAVLAMLISCLGLLGLIMFAAEQRTKEIGIRKVLGATMTNIINLLSKDFLKIVLLSFCVGAPVAGYLMNQWLDGFAFKIELSWWIFAMAGGVSLLIALLTVSVQAVSSALANPVNSLRSE